MKIWRRKGQNTAEYAILISLIVAVAVTMQTYVKRGLQGGIKFVVDKAKKSDTGTGQYEPYYLISSYDATTSSYKDIEQTKTSGEVERTYGADGNVKKTERTGNQLILDQQNAD
jgi:uncharacterized protein (UPF0333 family)